MNTAKIFKSGNSQAVRLPKEFRIKSSRVYIRKFGKGILIEPEFTNNKEWLDELSAMSGNLFGDREQPEKNDIREDI